MAEDARATLTQCLAEIAIETDNDEISSQAYDAAMKALLDAYGCALAGWNAPGIADVLGQMRDWGGKSEATTLFHGGRLPAPNAAFVNSAMIHALDYDDVYIPGTLHITSVIVPTALAVAEATGASSKDALAGLIMGIEVAGRLGIAYKKREKPPQGPGFLPTSVVGGFGATAAAARLLGLSVEQCVSAMGINYAQTSGNRQALLDMTLTKRLQPAFAARSAIWAVMLAARQVSGPPRALEGSAGFFQLYQTADPPDAEELTKPREHFEIERLSYKRWPSCGAIHPAQVAAERLVKEERLRPEQIDRVEISGISPNGLVSAPFKIGPDPQVSAQFSVQYGVALELLRGGAKIDHFTDEQILANKDVADLAQRITFAETPEPPPPPPPLPEDCPPSHQQAYHAVIVHTTDGRRLVRGCFPIEVFLPDNMTLAEVVAKFRDCARFSGICPPDRAEDLIAAITELDRMPKLADSPALRAAQIS